MSNVSQTLPCPEPGCGGRLRLTPRGRRWYYRCEHSTTTGCPGSHGAHPDGSPLGIPADQCTKRARMAAHAAFDRLWRHGGMTRTGAYRWLQQAMGLSEGEAHIGRFTAEPCRKLIHLAQGHGGRRPPA